MKLEKSEEEAPVQSADETAAEESKPESNDGNDGE